MNLLFGHNFTVLGHQKLIWKKSLHYPDWDPKKIYPSKQVNQQNYGQLVKTLPKDSPKRGKTITLHIFGPKPCKIWHKLYPSNINFPVKPSPQAHSVSLYIVRLPPPLPAHTPHEQRHDRNKQVSNIHI